MTLSPEDRSIAGMIADVHTRVAKDNLNTVAPKLLKTVRQMFKALDSNNDAKLIACFQTLREIVDNVDA